MQTSETLSCRACPPHPKYRSLHLMRGLWILKWDNMNVNNSGMTKLNSISNKTSQLLTPIRSSLKLWKLSIAVINHPSNYKTENKQQGCVALSLSVSFSYSLNLLPFLWISRTQALTLYVLLALTVISRYFLALSFVYSVDWNVSSTAPQLSLITSQTDSDASFACDLCSCVHY